MLSKATVTDISTQNELSTIASSASNPTPIALLQEQNIILHNDGDVTLVAGDVTLVVGGDASPQQRIKGSKTGMSLANSVW